MIIIDEIELKKPCQDASIFEAADIIKKLEVELANSKIPGIGLSANQIGIQKRVLIIRAGKQHLNLANPEIIEKYDLSEFDNEGCLSFPEEYITTKRYAEVLIKDLFHPEGIVLTGLMAVVAQHEISHTNGETMYDYQIARPKSPNEKCWCSSNLKYKKCHQNKIIK